jgi:hypothetical protein
MKYERMTDRNWKDFDTSEMYKRFAELEDKIERGELVDVKENHLVAISRASGKSSKQLKAIEILTKYENGTLVELPCKVGDTLYYVNMYAPTPRIEANFVHTIEMFEEGITSGLTFRIWTQDGVFYSDDMPNVFKTKAEAEAKLKEKIRNESNI